MNVRRTSEVYAHLYHYTTWQGALGILRTNHLWATHYKFLNDYSEIVHFKDRLIAFLRPHVLQEYSRLVSVSPEANQEITASGGLDEVVRQDTATIVDIFYRTAADEIYLASFCGENQKDEYINANGLLSQWRGYGGDGGIALVFRTNEVEKLLEKEAELFDYNGGNLADVVYSDNEKKFTEELEHKLPHIADYTRQLFLSMRLREKEPPDASQFYPALMNCITRFKHRGFREENEVRIVALPTRHNPRYIAEAEKFGQPLRPEKERKFREAGSRQIPYIEMFAGQYTTVPIERIIVGPHRDKEMRAAALRVMFRKTEIKVTISEIPYVC